MPEGEEVQEQTVFSSETVDQIDAQEVNSPHGEEILALLVESFHDEDKSVNELIDSLAVLTALQRHSHENDAQEGPEEFATLELGEIRASLESAIHAVQSALQEITADFALPGNVRSREMLVQTLEHIDPANPEFYQQLDSHIKTIARVLAPSFDALERLSSACARGRKLEVLYEQKLRDVASEAKIDLWGWGSISNDQGRIREKASAIRAQIEQEKNRYFGLGVHTQKDRIEALNVRLQKIEQLERDAMVTFDSELFSSYHNQFDHRRTIENTLKECLEGVHSQVKGRFITRAHRIASRESLGENLSDETMDTLNESVIHERIERYCRNNGVSLTDEEIVCAVAILQDFCRKKDGHPLDTDVREDPLPYSAHRMLSSLRAEYHTDKIYHGSSDDKFRALASQSLRMSHKKYLLGVYGKYQRTISKAILHPQSGEVITALHDHDEEKKMLIGGLRNQIILDTHRWKVLASHPIIRNADCSDGKFLDATTREFAEYIFQEALRNDAIGTNRENLLAMSDERHLPCLVVSPVLSSDLPLLFDRISSLDADRYPELASMRTLINEYPQTYRYPALYMSEDEQLEGAVFEGLIRVNPSLVTDFDAVKITSLERASMVPSPLNPRVLLVSEDDALPLIEKAGLKPLNATYAVENPVYAQVEALKISHAVRLFNESTDSSEKKYILTSIMECGVSLEPIRTVVSEITRNHADSYRSILLTRIATRFQGEEWLAEDVVRHYVGNALPEDLVRRLAPSLSNSFIERVLLPLRAIPEEKRGEYLEIIERIQNSPSQEIQRISGALTGELLDTDDPVGAYEKIEQVFIKNNLPVVGKVFKIFKILHPTILTNDSTSPVLRTAGERKKETIIYRDLLGVHIDSSNRSLRVYLETLQTGEALLKTLESTGALTPKEQKRLTTILDKFDTLLVNSNLGGASDTLVRGVGSIQERVSHMRAQFRVKEGQTVTDRVTEMFARPLGLESIHAVLERMREKKDTAHARGLEYARAQSFTLEEGDCLKGIDDKYLGTILQNGSVAKEYLGSGAQSDSTPYDTDVSMILPSETAGGIADAVDHSMAKGYGSLLFAVRDRGQFIKTQKDVHTYDAGKLEVFRSGGVQHYGIRTGFPSTEIDFMIAQDSLVAGKKRLGSIYFEIAKNGHYIPVVDMKGALLYTPEMYDAHRAVFEGLDQYDGGPFRIRESEVVPRTYQEDIDTIIGEMRSDPEHTTGISQKIAAYIRDVLAAENIFLKDRDSSSIIGAEIDDIGSTSRGTQTPGSYDFDFALKLDAYDFRKTADLQKRFLEGISYESTIPTSHNNQLRFAGVSRVGDTHIDPPFDLDIGITAKSDLAVFATHDAVSGKLSWIEDHLGVDARERVVANIVLAKKVLKEGGAYKRFEEGGLGGIGVENLILAYGGNMVAAFTSFLDASRNGDSIRSFEDFKKYYEIIDPGINVKFLNHDNFVERMKEEGYHAMCKAISTYLGAEAQIQA